MRWLTMVALVAGSAGAAGREKLVVLPFSGAEAETATVATEQLTTELSRSDRLEVISNTDVAALLGLERQRQLLGCGEEATSCLTEISAALGAPWLVQGSLGRVGGLLRVDVKLLATADGRAVVREGRTLSRDDELPAALAELATLVLGRFGYRAVSPGPTVALIAAGASALVGGALVVIALGQRQSLSTPELRALVTFNQAVSREGAANTMAVMGWAFLGAGASSAIVGLVWRLVDRSTAPPTAWLTPTGSGVTIGGVF